MRQIFNGGWEFLKLGYDTDKEEMRRRQEEFAPVDVPHDWLIYDTSNLYEDSRGWYRKKAHIRRKPGERVFLYFEGIYMDSEIYVNDRKVWEWKYGYSSFEVEITPYLNGEEEEILVCAAHKCPNSRWYSGAGMYRDVYLKVAQETCPVTDSLYVSAVRSAQEAAPAAVLDCLDKWTVTASVEVSGTQAGQMPVTFVMKRHGQEVCRVRTAATEPRRQSASADTPWCRANGMEPEKVMLAKVTMPVTDPVLWDIDRPELYELEAVLENGERVSTRFGFRYMEFLPEEGFFLNGRHVKLHGVCEHHDLGCLGSAYSRAAMKRKINILQEMGVNAIRTSHNMPAKDLMNLADEMGILIVSEAFDMWERAKTPYDYARFFKKWVAADVAAWVRRDRNHPSLIMWSIGNEIYDTHADEHGQELTKMLQGWVKELDPMGNAAVTLGSNFMPWENAQKCADLVKLAGYNYGEKYYEAHHQAHPDWVIYGSETASVVHSRGIYHFPLRQPLLADDDEQCSALGNSTTSWGAKSIERCIIGDRDAGYSMGQFIWTGFDYIGEPTPYHTKNSYFGQIDTAGFPKDAYYTFQAEWTDYRTKPMVHVFPCWDFNPGQMIDVRVCSNAPEVELFFGGESLGRRQIDHVHGQTLVQNWQVRYQPGCLVAVAYDETGREIARESRHSFGDSAEITLETDKDILAADGRDMLFVTIGTVDGEGHPVENAADYVDVSVTGAGRLVGLDNGDSTDYDSYKGTRRKLFSGRLLAVIAAKKEPGEIRVEVSGAGLKPAVLVLQAVAAQGQDIPLAEISATWENRKVTCTNDGVSVRKIEITSSEGQVLTPEKPQVEVKAALYPAGVQGQNLIWSAVTDAGIASPIARVEALGEKAIVSARADGEFMVRCMADDGNGKVKLISQLDFLAEGLGKPFLNPYEFVSGGLYSRSVGEVGNGNEKGVSSARDGVTQIGFTDVDFGDFGSDEITLPIFALDGGPHRIEIWEGMPEDEGSEKITDVIYQKPSIWNVYQPETYKLPRRLKGVTTLCFVYFDKVHTKGFSFTPLDKAYAVLNGADCQRVYGDSFVRKGQCVEGIGNNVTLELGEMDFGEKGTGAVTICGRTPLDKNTIHIRFNADGETAAQIVEFAGTAEYREQTFSLQPVTGRQRVEIVFLPGSRFDFGWIQFQKK